MKPIHYDFFVIGGGSGGVRAARIAAQHGAKVGLAEAKQLGGTCVNVGCVPKKLMAYAADYGFHFEDARGYGWSLEKPTFNWAEFIQRKNTEISRLNGIYQNILEKSGVVVHHGFASFVDKNTVDLGGQKISADHILIATGGKPRKLNIPGAKLSITSDEIFFFPRQPQHAVIYGGGYIGMEFAHILHGMGSKVTVIHRGDMFLRGFDQDIREMLAEEVRKQGIELLFNTEITKISEGMSVHTNTGQSISCDMVLSAIGRDPNTDKLNLENACVECVSGTKIKTDKYSRTSAKHIYAIGDATHTKELTPVAIAEGHALADRLFGGHTEKFVDLENVPTAMFSHPPVATVGLTEQESRDKGFTVQIFKSNFKPMKHTISGRDERSFMKLVVDQKTDKVLGVHMMGADAPEIVQGFAVALKAGATKAQFDATIGIHPSAAEEFVQMRTQSF